MKNHAPRILAASIALALAASVVPAKAEILYGINGANQLVSFDSANPNSLLTTVNISGATILNIDIRPATGVLYGLSDTNSLFTLDIGTGVASLVGAVAITGGFDYGFDFNPTADRLRIVLDEAADDNFRVIPTTGALVGGAADGDLNYASGDPNFGANPNAVGAAYTNNFPGATSTQLFYIDSDLDSLATTTNPNGGVMNTVGGLGFDTTGLVGFDISGMTGAAFASLSLDGSTSQLYSINLTSGSATAIGGIGSIAGDTILDIAAPVPEPTTALLGGLGMLTLLGRRRRAV
jgi:Domain of unknown function (DUF4394)